MEAAAGLATAEGRGGRDYREARAVQIGHFFRWPCKLLITQGRRLIPFIRAEAEGLNSFGNHKIFTPFQVTQQASRLTPSPGRNISVGPDFSCVEGSSLSVIIAIAPTSVRRHLALGSNETQGLKKPRYSSSSICTHSPVAARQSRTVSSLEADAIRVPSGEKAADQTPPLWPSSVCNVWLQYLSTSG
jgi:hypothetical protein